eukprot:133432-Heterocapsa_arctica.AAC.1
MTGPSPRAAASITTEALRAGCEYKKSRGPLPLGAACSTSTAAAMEMFLPAADSVATEAFARCALI